MSSTKIMWLMQFTEMTACFGENDNKHTNTTCRLNAVLFFRRRVAEITVIC